MNATLTLRPLNAADRCDRCGAQAYIRVVLEHGDLMFCGHHGRVHEARLRMIAVEWHDETSRLRAAPAPSRPGGPPFDAAGSG